MQSVIRAVDSSPILLPGAKDAVATVYLLTLALFVTCFWPCRPIFAQAYNPSGITVAGGNSQGNALNQFNASYGVFVDASGALYVSDRSNHRVTKWAPGATSGVVVAGGAYGGGASEFADPVGIYVDATGAVYVADRPNHRVMKWAPGATQGLVVAGGNGLGANPNQLNEPFGVFVDVQGNVYVADSQNHRIQKWAPGATQGVTVAGGNGRGPFPDRLDTPTNMFVDGAGAIYVADAGNYRIQKWLPGATQGVTVAGGNGYGPALNQLNFPTGVFVDGAGAVYVAEYTNNRVVKWAVGATQGVVVAGGNGQGAGSNQFDGPNSLFVDGAGTVYVADQNNHRVQKFIVCPSITAQPPSFSSVCAGATLSIPVGVSGTASSYQWYKNDAPVAGQTAPTLSLTGLVTDQTGSYRLVISGCTSLTSKPFSLLVSPVPPVSLSNNGPLTCATSSVTLTATTPSWEMMTYQLNDGETNNSGVFTISQPGTYSVTMTTSFGCTSRASTVVSLACGSQPGTIGQPLAILEPSYNCQTGVVRFCTSGGDGSPITYSAIGITGPTTYCSAVVDSEVALDIRNQRPNVQPFTLFARQGSVSVSYSWNALAACANPAGNSSPQVLRTIPPQSATVGVPYSLDLNGIFTDAETPGQLTVSAQSLPAGLNLMGNQILGTPTQAGFTNVAIKAMDPGGLTATLVFSLTLSQGSGTPPMGGLLSATVVSYNCQSGAITFGSTGGNGSTVEYLAIGVTGWTTNPAQTVEAGLRADPKPIYVRVRQSGAEGQPFMFDFGAYCASRARRGLELTGELSVRLLGNPIVGDRVEVALEGAGGQTVQVELMDSGGQLIDQRQIDKAESTEQVWLKLGGGSWCVHAAGTNPCTAAQPAGGQAVRKPFKTTNSRAGQ